MKIKKVYLGRRQIYPDGWNPGTNTIAYYKFDGNLNDSSGNNHNLSVNSGSVTYGTATGGGKYAHFDKNTRTNYRETNADFGGNHTISCWLNLQQIITGQNLGIFLDIWKSGNVFARLQESVITVQNGSAVGSYSVTANTRYLLTLTKNGNLNTMYINGNLINTATISSSGIYNIRFKINNAGDTTSTTYSHNLYLSELIRETNPRTAQEISDYYNKTKGNYGL